MFKYFLSLTIGILFSINTPGLAVEFPDGRVAFEKGLILLDAHATHNTVRIKQAIYYFDLELPKDIGEPLQQVSISQRRGSDRLKFRLDKTKAYLGTHNDKQQELNLSATQDEETEAITVVFQQPIPPGNKVTIGLKPKENPDIGGVYLFGITAFPAGKKPLGLYLGAARLQFYQNGDRFFR